MASAHLAPAQFALHTTTTTTTTIGRHPFQRDPNPSSPKSDTPYASDSSDLQTPSLTSQIVGASIAEPGFRNNRGIPSSSSLIRSRAETVSSPSSTSSSPVRRKPLPLTASPLATRFSSGEYLASTLELPEQPFTRPYSIDSPTLHEFPPTSTVPFPPGTYQHRSSSRTSDNPTAWASDSSSDPPSPIRSTFTQQPLPSPKSPSLTVPAYTRPKATPLAKHARLASDSVFTSVSGSTSPWQSDRSSTTRRSHSTMSIFSSKPTPPHKIHADKFAPPSRSYSNESSDSTSTIQKPLPNLPKSPGASKLGSFFSWGGTTSPNSSITTFSEKSYSPIPSPYLSESTTKFPDASRNSARNIPSALDIPKANADTDSYFGNAYLQLPLATPVSPIQVEEMEKELKEISAELAASIRREMDLEDLVERLQAEAQNSGGGKRTSDYFSDSGTSSIRYGDPESKAEELERAIRKTEQEKALMRIELSGKVQDEKLRRKQLESQIRSLEEKASQVDLASMNSLDANGRIRDLESTCEDLRRRLAEEKQVKDNFEDLLTALKGELASSHSERDNLRDEVIPQLRARVEGLEAQAAEHERLTYDQSKMQQELDNLKNEKLAYDRSKTEQELENLKNEKLTYDQSKMQQELENLKNENATLVNAQKMQMEKQQQMKKFNTILEDTASASSPPPSARAAAGLSRSNSVAHSSISRSRPPSLTRSTSVKTAESREALAERVKDVELQRDALHRALKSLLERQEYQNRENQKKIRQLELELDRALTNSPRRIGYDEEVAHLREEINTLRRRADEAIEQKWQCEKGLSGLKMDLDRAEQEISSLRCLLDEHDILIPPGTREKNGARPGSSHVSSESLEQAYKDLQKAYTESLDRIKNLELSSPMDNETERAMKQLEQSLAEAISERDSAQQEADSLRDQTLSMYESESVYVGREQVLADQLRESAQRVEDLSSQVRQQLEANAALRQRLADTVQRGENEQRTNSQKIMFMQSRLKTLEDRLMVAQQATEEKVSQHEEDIRNLKESHNLQLQRMKDGLKSPRSFGPKSPITPLFANSTRVPRLLSTSSGKAMTVSEDSKMEFLKQRVIELESALAEADNEMEEVVGRMNVAQIEVMELQNEREEAVRETRRLQREIEEERVRAFEGRFATLSS